MKKKVRVQLIGEAEKEFEKLNEAIGKELEKGIKNSQNQQLLKAIKKTTEILKLNPQYGTQIPRKQIPNILPVDNLWKVNLTGYWRLLYTLRGEKLEIICFILEIVDHKKYNKIFGYRKK